MTFLFTLMFMFLVFWRPQEWLVPWLYGWPLLDGITYGAVLMLLMESKVGEVRVPKEMPQIYLLLGLWVAAALSQIVHTYFGGLMRALEDVFKFCFFTLLLLVVIDRPARLRTMSTLIVGMACVMAVHAVMQDRTGSGFIGARPLWIPPMHGKPAYMRSCFFGIFSDPNDLAQMLVTAMPLTLTMHRRIGLPQALLTIGLCFVLYTGFETTHSRGGLVGLTASAGLLLCGLLPARWMPRLAGLGLVGALVLCGTKAGALLDASARERLEFWGYGNIAFKHNPLFGIGYDMFWQIARGRPAHNAFVTCYTELGLFGYFMWFNLIQLGLTGAWRARVQLRQVEGEDAAYLRRSVVVITAATGGFLASAYFLSRTFIFPLFFMLAMQNAIPLMAPRYLPDGAPPLIDVRRDVWLLGVVSTLISILYVYVSILLLNRTAHG